MTYNPPLEIEFDPAKNASNIAKHGISLVDADAVFADPNFSAIADSRRAYGELRFIGMGVVAGRVLVVVYTMRGVWCRIISLRKANRREQA
ncbi:MAG: BrnT family toxin [Alphaproteobacteria bacterium]